MKTKIEAIRNQLDAADNSRGDNQIGHILIALSQMLDLIEAMQPAAVEPDRYEAARHEYAAERRIDEYAAYQREQD